MTTETLDSVAVHLTVTTRRHVRKLCHSRRVNSPRRLLRITRACISARSIAMPLLSGGRSRLLRLLHARMDTHTHTHRRVRARTCVSIHKQRHRERRTAIFKILSWYISRHVRHARRAVTFAKRVACVSLVFCHLEKSSIDATMRPYIIASARMPASLLSRVFRRQIRGGSRSGAVIDELEKT